MADLSGFRGPKALCPMNSRLPSVRTLMAPAGRSVLVWVLLSRRDHRAQRAA